MNTSFLAIVKRIAAEQGEGILGDAARLKPFIKDYAQSEPQPLRIAFGRAVEAGSYSALKSAPEAAGRAARKAAIARNLWDNYGVDPALSAESLDILEAALFGEAKPSPAAPEAPLKPAASYEPSAPAKKNTRRTALIAAVAAAAVIAVIAGAAVYQRQQARAEAGRVEAALIEAARKEGAAGMVKIPGGTFMMGSPANEAGRFDDEVQHQVTVSSFYMGKHDITQREWREVMESNPSNFKGDNLPVEWVVWYDAVEYCNRRSLREGYTPAYRINGEDVTWERDADGYRLPAEAEWEYACRAGTTTPFNTGHKITTAQANYDWYYDGPVAVGSFAPNPWGLYDMPGNISKWCYDWYGAYPGGAETNPAGPSTGVFRVSRGGAWYLDAPEMRSARRGCREPYPKGEGGETVRLVRNAE